MSDYGFDFERAIVTNEGSDVANVMLRQLMEAMGEPIGARPESPQRVWEEMLGKVAVLEARGAIRYTGGNGDFCAVRRAHELRADGVLAALYCDKHGYALMESMAPIADEINVEFMNGDELRISRTEDEDAQ